MMDIPVEIIWQAFYKLEELDLLNCLIENNVDRLKSINHDLLYMFEDEYGNSVLHIAIERDLKEIFDYLLSLPSYPLDRENLIGFSPLFICFERNREYFALELIRKGACTSFIDGFGHTFLHYAAMEKYNNVMQVLLEQGINVNAQNYNNCTALHTSLDLNNPDPESISILLYYNANLTICNNKGKNPLEKALCLKNVPSFSPIQEHMFNLTCDENFEFSLDFIIELIKQDSPFFYTIANFKQINIDETIITHSIDYYINFLFSMELAHFKIFLSKFEPYVKNWLKSCRQILKILDFKSTTIEIFRILLESDLADDVIEFIASCIRIEHLILSYFSEDLIYFLLNYGMIVTGVDLEELYFHCGYSDGYDEFFEHLLFQDIVIQQEFKHIIPDMMFDLTLDMDECWRDAGNYVWSRYVFDFFRWPQTEAYIPFNWRMTWHESSVPSLVELARNKTRKFLVEKFQIRNSRQFYTLLRRLPIPKKIEDIIALKKKLYFFDY